MTKTMALLCLVFCFVCSAAHAEFYPDQNESDNSSASYQNYDFNKEFPASYLQDDNTIQSQPQEKTEPGIIQTSNTPTKTYDSNRTYNYDLPTKIQTNEKVVLVDPNVHAWGAYSAEGNLIRAGRATSGNEWCPDIDRPCKTKAGVFRVYSLGSSDCISSKYPIEEGGGAPMPYCMYFNGAQGLHGSNHVVEDNISHGCVRLRVSDAAWLRFHFVTVGTKVIVKPY